MREFRHLNGEFNKGVVRNVPQANLGHVIQGDGRVDGDGYIVGCGVIPQDGEKFEAVSSRQKKI